MQVFCAVANQARAKHCVWAHYLSQDHIRLGVGSVPKSPRLVCLKVYHYTNIEYPCIYIYIYMYIYILFFFFFVFLIYIYIYIYIYFFCFFLFIRV